MEFRKLFPPTIDGTVYVEITHKCNYSCKHCYAKCPSNKEMSFEQIKKLAYILKRIGFNYVIKEKELYKFIDKNMPLNFILKTKKYINTEKSVILLKYQ